MKFFDFNEDDYNYIVKKCMLNEEYAKLLEMEIKGYTRNKMAQTLHLDVSVLDKMIAKLKKKIKRII